MIHPHTVMPAALPCSASLAMLAQLRRGLTLIELVLVIVLIGILSAVAAARVSVTRERAVLGAMQSDLRNLVTAQEAYFSDHEREYARRVQDIGYRFNTSPGVHIRLTFVSPRRWIATAEHASSRRTCSVSVDGDQRSTPTCTPSSEARK